MKHLLFSLLFFAFLGSLFAEKVNLEDAKTYAVNAYYQKLNLYHETVQFEDVKIEEVFDIKRNGESVYYIFNIHNYGYIIISAEDVLNPVQAYSFSSQYISREEMDNFNGWLSSRAGAVVYARENGLEAKEETLERWARLKDISTMNLTMKGKNVEPLTTQTWNQDYPYNYMMPMDPNGPGGRTYVGCVATAMAQIMFYYRYPLQGSGSKTHSYGGYPAVTANFGQTTYDWDAMLDNSDQHVNIPMAEIGLHAAVAVEMHWGPNGSGAYSSDVPGAMKNYFNYNNSCYYIQKTSGMSWSIWKNYLDQEIDAACPIYYSGTDAQMGGSGHAFVCDGYHSDGTYHFNFGWSGQGNGWFDITSPSGYEWYYNQGIVRYLYPDESSYPHGCIPNYERNTLVGSFEDGSGAFENYDASADCSWLISPQTAMDSVETITLHFVEMDTDPDDIVTVYDGASTSAPVLGTFSGTTVPTDYLTSTGNQMLVTFEGDGDAVTGSGWRIEYHSTQPDYCSSSVVEFNDPVGSFSDGSGSFYYKNNSNCMWSIEPEFGNGLTLTFTEFETEEEYDYLQVYDASNNQLLGEFSGNDIPDPIYVESGELFFIWKTDGAMTYPGWSADWTVDNVGIDEASSSLHNLTVYPNPADDQLKISFDSDERQTIRMNLMTLTGESVYTETISMFSGNYVNSVNLSGFASGVYFLNLTSEKGSVNEKVVIR